METAGVGIQLRLHTSMEFYVVFHGGFLISIGMTFDRQADLVDISLATDIHGTPFDDPANPIAVGGVLNPMITAAHYVPFVNYLNTTQLAKFGVHNGAFICAHHSKLEYAYLSWAGPPNDVTLIAGKWESLALAPVDDENYPHDYFLFTAVSGAKNDSTFRRSQALCRRTMTSSPPMAPSSASTITQGWTVTISSLYSG